ncbi:uncharacterized protein LOC126834420 isoform X2 [Adelges cooleyi]|uniref:uncharacterized protein LOC126834420 isoform X2 n=1 Tax=Adelges cooleyi TaxID=133065 RepID=UPI00217F805D|nr:uncharacterized protein LOC126834420 isoform X2 [Adelges cooleyi]
MSFALVNVLVAHIDSYYREVVDTNADIKCAGDFMWEAIRFIISLNKYSMEELAFMLAVPELADRHSPRNKNCQIEVREHILSAVGISACVMFKDDLDCNVDLSFYGNKR